MNIAVIAATGQAGLATVRELSRRGHTVTAVVRDPARLPSDLPDTVTAVRADLANTTALTAALAGHDAVVSAFGPNSSDPRYTTDINYTDQLVDVTERLISIVEDAAAGQRLLVVGGAGSLQFSPGVTVLDSGHWPEPFRNIAISHTKALQALRASSINWTYFSPPMLIQAGERTGTFRLGADDVIFDADGNNTISYEDYAVALVDELESPHYERARFTAAY